MPGPPVLCPRPSQPTVPHRRTVLKFGGTSVSRRDRWDEIADRFGARRAKPGRVLVVVIRAVGRDQRTDDHCRRRRHPARIAALLERHHGFCAELGLDPGARCWANACARPEGAGDDPRAASHPLDWQAEVLAQGELLSSTLGAAYLRARGLDFGWMRLRATG